MAQVAQNKACSDSLSKTQLQHSASTDQKLRGTLT